MITDNNIQSTAIVLAGHLVNGTLRDVFGKRETASLMIAGCSIIEHILRELDESGFTQCIVLAGNNATEIHSLVNKCRHWRMSTEVVNYLLNTDEVLLEFKSLSQPNGLLVIEANRLRSQSILSFIDECDKTDYVLYKAMGVDGDLGLSYLKPSSSDFIINPKHILMDEVVCNPLENASDFYCANLDLIQGKFTGLHSSVASHSNGSTFQHWSAKVNKRCQLENTSVMIDQKCRVERNVKLNSVILNKKVYVEKNSILENTIVMPNVVIPANQVIRNAIVSDQKVYELSTI